MNKLHILTYIVSVTFKCTNRFKTILQACQEKKSKKKQWTFINKIENDKIWPNKVAANIFDVTQIERFKNNDINTLDFICSTHTNCLTNFINNNKRDQQKYKLIKAFPPLHFLAIVSMYLLVEFTYRYAEGRIESFDSKIWWWLKFTRITRSDKSVELQSMEVRSNFVRYLNKQCIHNNRITKYSLFLQPLLRCCQTMHWMLGTARFHVHYRLQLTTIVTVFGETSFICIGAIWIVALTTPLNTST